MGGECVVRCLGSVRTLKITSWNCFGAAQTPRAFVLREGAPEPHRFRHPDVASVLAASDVVCLQELWVRDAVDLFERLPHPHKATDDNRTEWWPLTIGGSGLGVASKLPVKSRRVGAFSRPHAGAERFARKGMLHVHLDAGAPVHVVSTHFQSGTSASARRVRARHARELGALIASIGEDDAVIVCGDFNVDGRRPVRHDEYAVLVRALPGFVDLGADGDVETYHPHPVHNALAHRFDRQAWPQRIDYVFFRPPARGGVSVAGFGRALDALLTPFDGGPAVHPSDHFALWVELAIA